MSRNGKHKDGNVLIGAVVPPRKKAIMLVTAAVIAGEEGRMSQSDLLWMGVERLAIQYEVLDANGQLTDKYRGAVELAEASVVSDNQNNRGTRGGKR